MTDYILNQEQENSLWRTATIVFDTSALLNLYEFSEKSRDDIFNFIASKLKNKIWLPYNVQYEYIKNREKPINSAIKSYEDLIINYKSMYENFVQIKNRTKSGEKHPTINPEIISGLEKEMGVFKENFDKEIKSKISILNGSKENDDIYNFIIKNFSFGKPYSHSKIIEIIKEGEFRYANFLPPGYMDQKDKLGFQKYADLIIWKQIIEYSNDEKKPIILIMDDLKEDWWVLDKKRKPIMPRPELVEEIRESGNAEFWMYTISDFLKKFPELIEETTIQEVQNVTDNRDELYKGKILLTAHRSREEPFRIKRLQNVANFLELIIDIDNLFELNDYKGMLTATWKKNPTDFEKSSVELGWEHENEPSGNVSHETAGNIYNRFG